MDNKSNILITVESGSDLIAEEVERYGIFLMPMHVRFGDVDKIDGTFPPTEIIEYYKETGKTPTTAGSSPDDCTQVFDMLHEKYPDKQILHIAYSAVTTCSYASAVIASEGRDYVRCVDSKHCSGGLAAVAMHVAEKLIENPDWTIDQAAAEAEKIATKTHMFFVPDNLQFLKAGGRCSNAEYLAGTLLKIHPLIDVIDGYLKATKRYRGATTKLIPKIIKEYTETYSCSKRVARLLYTVGFAKEQLALAEQTMKELGFKNIIRQQCQCVITTHGGPGAFGMVYYEEM